MKIIMELQDITKQYREKIVLENTSFSIYANQVVALVGKNGSGKSTLLKIIGGLVKPDSGVVHKYIQPLKIGYVPEVTPSHILFTPEEYLTHMGNIRGMAKGQIQQRIDNLIETFNLQDARKTRIEHFSKGMKQKVAIMQAMLEETDLLILDEPLSGLDPISQSDLEGILLILKERGLSVVLTCHETKLLENIVDRVLLIKDHQVIQTSSLQGSVNKGNRFIFAIATETSLEELLPFIEIQQERHLNSGVNEIEATVNQEDTDKILLELLKRGASIKQLIPIHRVEEGFYNHF
ncbi:ABC transporter ATP-binding protein [Viridibacillus sp. YIM B01967]|uniref:ABC transporter ATP-binding protein n=1 Tax=Viridibacillus soli TaxID=2798301 RepID=A0ABS1H3D8_9BACL|nr:ABC transporter ATP-binding protein [Viridibacillus soli]MBK3493905.1 ABC transporter ATP-binding protein [Viridibacillus soli]